MRPLRNLRETLRHSQQADFSYLFGPLKRKNVSTVDWPNWNVLKINAALFTSFYVQVGLTDLFSDKQGIIVAIKQSTSK